jgi:hypothetical protein
LGYLVDPLHWLPFERFVVVQIISMADYRQILEEHGLFD